MSTKDLQALFANIRPKSQDPSISGSTSNYPAASPLGSQRTPSGYFPGHPAFMPNESGAAANNMVSANANSSKSDTAQNLLNLLNFGASAPSPSMSSSAIPAAKPATEPQLTGTGQSMGMSASELVAKFMSPPSTAKPPEQQNPSKLEDQGGGGKTQAGPKVSSDPQDALLKLLSKSKSVSTRSPESRKSADESNKTGTPTQVDLPAEPSKQEEPARQETKPIFTYVNPFEKLNASRNQTPTSGTPAPPPAPQSPIFKNIPDTSDNVPEAQRSASPLELSGRKILTPRSASAKAQRLVRESSMRSAATPEPASKEESPAPGVIKSVEIPISSGLPVAEGVKEEDVGPDEIAVKVSPPAENGIDEWEDAEESPPSEAERVVPVYNFPIRPFVAIMLQLDHPSDVQIRENGVMEISRLKKDFDQLDRSLASATAKYISYALVKGGGMRIIRQEDGTDRQVFKNSNDRVFNVSFCTTATNSPPSEEQAVLGTGISGTVYYATISKEGNDLFEKNAIDSEAVILPPWPPADENSAGGVLKTRARCSSRHPEFFAIGRGKSIHLIWPANAMCPKYGVTDVNRTVNMEKLYVERNLQIATGKAGKDFAFSEDDTLIVSLDKTGRLRFWDIRELTDETNATSARVNPIKVDTPLLSLSTASPAEKSWPTSVSFVDKARPYVKGGALRYVLVGLRQNHTLQLWDIALGKAVQELNFPHENETDGICSVNYHPASGIVVVGHPTRNSIFFIHLSAPRYTLSSSTSQASYIQRIAMKDASLPKPDSTACMSGIREMSFASKGQLRSLDLLHVTKEQLGARKEDDKTPVPLFELYAVHSKGVTCLPIAKEDLGWDENSKVVNGVDAAAAGVVSCKELKLGSIIEENRSKSPPDENTPPAAFSTKSSKKSKKKALAAEALEEVPPPPEPAAEVPREITGAEAEIDTSQAMPVKEGKKSKKEKKEEKKAAQALAAESLAAELALGVKAPSRSASPAKHSVKPVPPEPSSEKASDPITATEETDAQGKSSKVSLGISGDWLDKELRKIEQGVAKEFRKELSTLYTNLQDERVVQDTAASSRQEQVLRLVSHTLTNNVEKAIANIVAVQFQQVVVPAVSSVVASAVHTEVGNAISRTLPGFMPHELGKQLPHALGSALSSPQLTRSINENVSQKIGRIVENQLNDTLGKQLMPTLTRAANATAEVEARLGAQIRKLEEDRQRDTGRLEKLSTVISGMAETLQSMSDTQVAFQGQILRDRQQLAVMSGSSQMSTSRQLSTARITPSPGPITRPVSLKPKTEEEIELEEISALMSEGRYEEGSIRWLHSSHQSSLFDSLFVRFTPEYLQTDVSALVAFSIAVTVVKDMSTNMERRLEWISSAMDAVDLNDTEIAELSTHAPQLLDTLISKVEGLYMQLAEQDNHNPVLKLIPPVAKKARAMRGALGSANGRLGGAQGGW